MNGFDFKNHHYHLIQSQNINKLKKSNIFTDNSFLHRNWS